ncbi:MAG: glucans biosynthesis glucosyltransferase MdoH [Rhodobacteraceae bacterium]|nr:glucans biosynthesis glucosyltransferase MdoH [Paracoccaceae bacterium]
MVRALTVARRWQLGAVVALAVALVGLLALGLDLPATHPWLAALVLALFALNALWLAGAAVTAVLGVRPLPASVLHAHVGAEAEAAPGGRTAILWLICGEPVAPVAARVRAMLAGLARTGQAGACDIFILSDTQGAAARAAEADAFAALGAHVHYRNRACPEGRKPGNLADWMARNGGGYDTVLLLDADSGFCAERLRGLRAWMAADPRLGLVQCAIRLRPGGSRLAAMQRLSVRLCGAGFARGLARLSGDAGNFWGHNALIRTRALAAVTPLPALSGRAPWGGPVLSHDFIEAAALRRAGWKVVIDADARGSFEDAPETVAEFLRRDRRWAQGNLQHLRLVGAKGWHPASRVHMLAGIQSYLSAPVWLALVVLFGSGAVHATAAAAVPLAATLALLLVPKAAGWADWRGRGRMTAARRRILRRAFGAEVALTTLFAPLAMVRRTGFVAAVLAGRDCGWRPAGAGGPAALASARAPARARARALAPARAPGRAEAVAGGAILLAVTGPQMALGAGLSAAVLAAAMVAPVIAPLLAAPWLVRGFDRPLGRHIDRPIDRLIDRPCDRAPAGPNRVAAYYDASTRRFLRLGGSGAALAIHRPLWAEGVADLPAASDHVNALVAEAAEAALGRPPAQVCDLGCGVGGTLFHLAARWPEAALTGVTLSAEQVRIGRAQAQARGLAERVRVVRSDFTHPPTLPQADLVIAIESHVHAASAGAFLQAARAHLRPGGVLVVVDDMLAVPDAALTARGRRLLDAFRRGWRLGHVTPAAGLIAAARAEGFAPAAEADLSRYLRLNRLRDRALRLAGPLADALGLGRVPLFANMIGGNALTEAHRAGLLRYQMVVLRDRAGRVADPAEGRAGKQAA